jgi:probable F420-dependent oxidoreductase
MAAADATETLRVGALVWDNDYKHPVVLAKEIATLDLLSEGRVEVGIGAGWQRSDYDWSGIPYDPPGVRVDRFEEGLAVLKGLLGTDGAFSFTGAHYRVDGLDGRPKPFQRPWPPILIGGGGPRVLRIAAREADIVGINATMTAGVVGPEVLATMTAAAVEEKVGWVRAAATQAGRLDAIEWNIRVFFVSFTNDRRAVAEQLAATLGFTPDDLLASPFALIGTAAQMVEDLRERRERYGFSYIIVGTEVVDEFAPVVAELAGV